MVLIIVRTPYKIETPTTSSILHYLCSIASYTISFSFDKVIHFSTAIAQPLLFWFMLLLYKLTPWPPSLGGYFARLFQCPRPIISKALLNGLKINQRRMVQLPNKMTQVRKSTQTNINPLATAKMGYTV